MIATTNLYMTTFYLLDLGVLTKRVVMNQNLCWGLQKDFGHLAAKYASRTCVGLR